MKEKEEDFDLHNYQKKINKLLKKIEESNVSENNKKDIIGFKEQLTADGKSLASVIIRLFSLFEIAKLLENDFEKTTKIDMVKVFNILRSRYKECTISNIGSTIKLFYKWKLNTEEYPEVISWIKIKKNDSNLLPENILTKEEIEKFADEANNLRDKVIVLVLWATGFRVSEFLRLKIKNVFFENGSTFITVEKGKTGKRTVRVDYVGQYLKTLIYEHPFKENPDAPLWITINYLKKRLNYGELFWVLRRLAKKVEIKKPANPHAFRHSRATYLAKKGMNESQMRIFFGWSKNSDMPSLYIHLAGKDVNDNVAKYDGIEIEEEEINEKKPKRCSRCKEINEAKYDYCYKCGQDLNETEDEMIKKDIERSETDKILDEAAKYKKEIVENVMLANDPEFALMKKKFMESKADKKKEEGDKK